MTEHLSWFVHSMMMKESPVAAAAVHADQASSARTNGASAAPADADQAASMRAEVEKVIAAVRPAVQADRGDIVLISVDTDSGVVEVELQGACTSCPASSQTLKAGVERIMKDRVPGITEVVNVGQLYYDDGTAVTL
jgi:Fe-S cluster biogenesis protein NfuA